MTFDVPKGWSAREADYGEGDRNQLPGATGNADIIRIMEPMSKYPKGHFRYYNEHGEPQTANDEPGPNSATRFPEDYEGPAVGWPR